MHRDALAACDVSDDVFPAYRVTTTGAVDEHVSLAADGDGVVVSEDAADHTGETTGLRSQAFRLDVTGDRWSCTRRQQARPHLPGGVLSVADAGHQVFSFAEPVSGSYALQIFVFDFLQGNSVFARFFFDQLTSDFDGTFPLMYVEPVLDFIAGARGLNEAKPVTAGLVAGLREDFDDVSGVQLVAQRDHASVDLGAGTGMPNFRVDGVGKIDRSGVARKNHDFALGCEGVDLFGVEIDFQSGKEFVGITDITLPFDDLSQPGETLLILSRDRAIFVLPVGRDAFLSHLVHLFGADLDFEGRAIFRDDRGMKRLIEIRPRHGDKVFNAAGHGAPQVVNDAEDGVAILQRARDHAHRVEIVDLFDGDALAL